MAITGAILGDIIGSRFEYKRTEDPFNVELLTEENEFTDDTVMTLAIKNAIDQGISYQDSMREIGRNYPYCGYGNSFFEWIFSTNPHPYNSWGNGSAMRVSYIGEHFENIDDVIENAKATAAVTHNHPEGIKGSITTAVCIWMAKHGKDKEEILRYALQMYPAETYYFNPSLELKIIREKYAWDVKCNTSVPVAIRCFYESKDYISFIRNVLSLDCDADTLCAIGGGIAEEFYGKTGIKNDVVLNHYLDETLLGIYYK